VPPPVKRTLLRAALEVCAESWTLPKGMVPIYTASKFRYTGSKARADGPAEQPGCANMESHWGSDFFGTLNELPAEPVNAIGDVLESMRTLPAFRDARRWVLGNLGISRGAAIVEAGCGTGAACAELLELAGSNGRIVGVDPTKPFVEKARARANQLRAANVRYEVGDIRTLPLEDNQFDAAFCDKVLLHAGPAPVALGELARVTKPSGRVGAIEWLTFFSLSATRPELTDAFNAVFRKSMYDYHVSANLARYFHRAGLSEVQVKIFLADTNSLDAHPFWRTFIIHQMPMFVHAGLIDDATGRELIADLEGLNAKGEFSASFIVQAAVGTKPVR
jgi:ubiquinone/menaquinone biosynthesis C-methylase UbiE